MIAIGVRSSLGTPAYNAGVAAPGAAHEAIPIAAGRYRCTISAPAAVASVLRPMLGDMVRPSGSPSDPCMLVAPDGDNLRVSVDGRRWEPGSDQTVCDQVLYVLLRASLDAEPDLLHLHTAYVALDGRGALIAGPPGSGKSTLVARLVESGFDYLTDERVGVDADLGLVAHAKPISLVRTSFDVLPHLDPARTGRGAASHRLWHVPASAVRPGSVVAAAAPRALVIVQYRPGQSASVSEVHPATAARLLLSDSVDAGRFGPRSVGLAARLCASLRCARLDFGGGSDVLTAMRAIVSSRPAPPPEVEELPPGRARRHRVGSPKRPEASSVLDVSGDMSGVVVDGRAVLYRSPGAEIIELDERSTAWLRLLDGETTLRSLAGEVAAANDLPADEVLQMAIEVTGGLRELGVVA